MAHLLYYKNIKNYRRIYYEFKRIRTACWQAQCERHYLNRSKESVKSLILCIDNEYHIVIDSSATFEQQTEMLAHELGHYFTETLSEVGTDNETILQNEMIANEYMRRELIKDEK